MKGAYQHDYRNWSSKYRHEVVCRKISAEQLHCHKWHEVFRKDNKMFEHKRLCCFEGYAASCVMKTSVVSSRVS